MVLQQEKEGSNHVEAILGDVIVGVSSGSEIESMVFFAFKLHWPLPCLAGKIPDLILNSASAFLAGKQIPNIYNNTARF